MPPEIARPSNRRFVLALAGLAALLVVPIVARTTAEVHHERIVEVLEPARQQIGDAIEAAQEASEYALMAYPFPNEAPHPAARDRQAYYRRLYARWTAAAGSTPVILRAAPEAGPAWDEGRRAIDPWLRTAGTLLVHGEMPEQRVFMDDTMGFQAGIRALNRSRDFITRRERLERDAGNRANRVGMWVTTALGAVFLALAAMTWRNAQTNRLLWARERRATERLEVAIRETNHRVKNNLQVVAALVDMQLMDAGAEVPRDSLEELARQIKAVAAVHDFLSHEITQDAVPGGLVLQRLANLTAGPIGLDVRVDADETVLPVKQATAVALMVNELLLNSSKHGATHVAIALRSDGTLTRVEAHDDGPGFPPDFSPDSHAHIGIALVDSLARRDLKGDVDFANDHGAKVAVTFPLEREG